MDDDDYSENLVPALKAAVGGAQATGALYLIEALDQVEALSHGRTPRSAPISRSSTTVTWKRSAIVTDIEWMGRASKLFLRLFPREAPGRVCSRPWLQRGEPDRIRHGRPDH